MKIIVLLLIIQHSLSQFQSLITTCFQAPDHYFCNHRNKSLRPKTKEYLTYGWCCPIGRKKKR